MGPNSNVFYYTELYLSYIHYIFTFLGYWGIRIIGKTNLIMTLIWAKRRFELWQGSYLWQSRAIKVYKVLQIHLYLLPPSQLYLNHIFSNCLCMSWCIEECAGQATCNFTWLCSLRSLFFRYTSFVLMFSLNQLQKICFTYVGLFNCNILRSMGFSYF